jgi:hypothetical protein
MGDEVGTECPSFKLGEYKMLKHRKLRSGPSIDSQIQEFPQEKGTVITVTQAVELGGKIRIKGADGWMTYADDAYEYVGADADSTAAKKKSGRKMSVAFDGIAGVTDLNARAAAMCVCRTSAHIYAAPDPPFACRMGTLADAVYTVRQEHHRDVMPICQLKVGGMGVSLFNGDSKIESYLYTEIARWLARSECLCRHCFARLMHPLRG